MVTYVGIDWSSQKHDVCFVNEAGAAIARQVIAHTPAGFAEFERQRQRLGVEPAECVIGIETAHNLVLDYLWGHHYHQVYVIPPNKVNRESTARWPSGARSDPSAAYLLADLLRQDTTRFPVWRPDSLLTRQMRSRVSLVMHLTHHIVQMANRLRAVLWRYYPVALTVFSELTAQIELVFITAYPTPQAAAQLTYAEFQAFAAQPITPSPANCQLAMPACSNRSRRLTPAPCSRFRMRPSNSRTCCCLWCKPNKPNCATWASCSNNIPMRSSSTRCRPQVRCWPQGCWSSSETTGSVSRVRRVSKPWPARAPSRMAAASVAWSASARRVTTSFAR
jgi:hypothetical protein